MDALIESRDFTAIETKCLGLAAANKPNSILESVIAILVRFIEAEEHGRGPIARSARSRLADDAERCQAILDKVMLALLGLGENKHDYIRVRLKQML